MSSVANRLTRCRPRGWLFASALALALPPFLIAEAHMNVHDPENLKVGKTAPEIAGVSPDGRPMKLSDYQGRVVVVDFFGDW